MSVKYTSNIQAIKSQMQVNVDKALTAMGVKAVKGVKDKINIGYYPTRKVHQAGHPINTAIRDTSTLFNDINYNTDIHSKTVDIGTNIQYALYVHEGTRRMKPRPYLKDGIMENGDKTRKLLH